MTIASETMQAMSPEGKPEDLATKSAGAFILEAPAKSRAAFTPVPGRKTGSGLATSPLLPTKAGIVASTERAPLATEVPIHGAVMTEMKQSSVLVPEPGIRSVALTTAAEESALGRLNASESLEALAKVGHKTRSSATPYTDRVDNLYKTGEAVIVKACPENLVTGKVGTIEDKPTARGVEQPPVPVAGVAMFGVPPIATQSDIRIVFKSSRNDRDAEADAFFRKGQVSEIPKTDACSVSMQQPNATTTPAFSSVGTAGQMLLPNDQFSEHGAESGLGPPDQRSGTPPTPIAIDGKVTTSPLGTTVVRQICEAVQSGGNKAEDGIDLRLNPEELGHIRFRMVNGEQGFVIQITADRPETLELLRRHIEQLGRSLSELGYDNPGFEFGGDASKSNSHGKNPQPLIEQQVAMEPGPVTHLQLKITDGGLDLRI